MAYHKQNNKYAVGVQKREERENGRGVIWRNNVWNNAESLKQEFKNPRRVSNSKYDKQGDPYQDIISSKSSKANDREFWN